MDSKKLINYSEVSQALTGNRSTIRANRPNETYAAPMEELLEFLDQWVAKNAKSKKATVTIKSK